MKNASVQIRQLFQKGAVPLDWKQTEFTVIVC